MTRSRWFHLPRLHLPRPGHERRVGWLELFYDLIYVATIIQLGNGLAADASLLGFLRFAGLFTPLWLTWTGFTFYTNRFVIDDVLHRSIVFAQMFAVAGMAVVSSRVGEGQPGAYFAFYALARFMLVAMYVRTWRQHAESRDYSRRMIVGFSAGAVLWAISSVTPTPWAFFLWALATGVDLGTTLSPAARAIALRFAPDLSHMSERYGLLVLIVLGESFVKVLDAVSSHGLAGNAALMAASSLLVTVSLWWIYFDDVAGSRIRKGALTPFVWVYSHLPLTLAITAVGVAIKKVVLLDPMAPAPQKAVVLLCGSLGLAMLAVGVVDRVTERRLSVMSDRARENVRFGSAAILLLFAPIAHNMSALAFVGLISGLCLFQVFFDLSMAPEEAPELGEHEHAPAEIQPPTEAIRPPNWRFDPTDMVRIGTPDELKRDLYFHLMESSWGQLAATLAGVYLGVNAIFAALYLMEPGSVSNVAPGSFFDAYAFSVQTIATIGYGVFAPTTTWAHTLVLVESAVGLVGMALMTGLVFARVSRPRSSVLFSAVAVITRMDGVPTLCLRVGNARGNEVIDATMRVVAVMDVVTTEGHSMRRLTDLKLVRDNSPLFTLSWMAMHRIDEASPFFAAGRNAPPPNLRNLIVTLSGHDGTYNQTITARHSYMPEDLRYGTRFVDVISNAPDGRLMVDYRRFHDVLPDPHFSAAPAARSGA